MARVKLLCYFLVHISMLNYSFSIHICNLHCNIWRSTSNHASEQIWKRNKIQFKTYHLNGSQAEYSKAVQHFSSWKIQANCPVVATTDIRSIAALVLGPHRPADPPPLGGQVPRRLKGRADPALPRSGGVARAHVLAVSALTQSCRQHSLALHPRDAGPTAARVWLLAASSPYRTSSAAPLTAFSWRSARVLQVCCVVEVPL